MSMDQLKKHQECKMVVEGTSRSFHGKNYTQTDKHPLSDNIVTKAWRIKKIKKEFQNFCNAIIIIPLKRQSFK